MADSQESVLQRIRETCSESKLSGRERLIAIQAALLQLPIDDYAQIMGVAQNQSMSKGVPAGYSDPPAPAVKPQT